MSVDLNPEIFRAYDIRGKAADDLTPDVVKQLGLAFGSLLNEKGKEEVLVGYDNRTHSPRIQRDLIRGLLETGCTVLDLGLTVTPVFYYARQLYDVDGGLMITGSHNPPEYNGFKIALGPGTLYGEQIQDLRRRMQSGRFHQGQGEQKRLDAFPNYRRMLKQKIKLNSDRRLKVVADCGNGTASQFAVEILSAWDCDVIPLYCESDPEFPHHHPDPVQSENLKDLVDRVLEEGADVGVAYDGDADRLGVVDDSGTIRWGDELMILFWRDILPRYPGTDAIIEVKCSQALVDEVKRLGGRPLFYKTGHSLIKAKMRELDAVFTGEMSGHMFFADEYYGFDDAFYATGRLLRILAESERSLSELLADAPSYESTGETRVPCAEADKEAAVKQVKERFTPDYDVIDVDGARVQFEQGWGLVRASNTSPKLVTRCEASSASALEDIKQRMHDALVETGAVDSFQWKE